MASSIAKFLEELLHGTIAGLSMVVVSHPVDTIKTRKQMETFRYHEMIRSMIRREGPLSFYKGVLSPAISLPLLKSVLYATYKTCLVQLKKERWFEQSPETQIAVASVLGGFVSALVVGPSDLFKVKLQIQRGRRDKVYSGYWDCFQKIRRVSGLRGVTQGLGVTILRDCISYPVHFIYYERVLEYYGNGDRNDTNNLHQFIAGAVSGTMAWTIIFPLDVVKSQMQGYTLKKNVRAFNNFQIARELRKVYRLHGILGFYHGLGIYMGRAFFGSGIAFMVWNWCQQNMKFV